MLTVISNGLNMFCVVMGAGGPDALRRRGGRSARRVYRSLNVIGLDYCGRRDGESSGYRASFSVATCVSHLPGHRTVLPVAVGAGSLEPRSDWSKTASHCDCARAPYIAALLPALLQFSLCLLDTGVSRRSKKSYNMTKNPWCTWCMDERCVLQLENDIFKDSFRLKQSVSLERSRNTYVIIKPTSKSVEVQYNRRQTTAKKMETLSSLEKNRRKRTWQEAKLESVSMMMLGNQLNQVNTSLSSRLSSYIAGITLSRYMPTTRVERSYLIWNVVLLWERGLLETLTWANPPSPEQFVNYEALRYIIRR